MMEWIIAGLLLIGWLVCGALSWGMALHWSYELGRKFPILGSPEEQWQECRRRLYRDWAAAFVVGPFGIIPSLICFSEFGIGWRLK